MAAPQKIRRANDKAVKNIEKRGNVPKTLVCNRHLLSYYKLFGFEISKMIADRLSLTLGLVCVV